MILIYTGFRINELFNITKNNVNLSDLYLIGGSKTESGKNRLMPINEKITDFILYFYNKSDSQYLIPNEDGGKKDAGNFRKREFYPFLSSLNITGITPHCTRHTFATLGQAAGIAPEDMIKLIGHADYSTTTENYVHQNIDKLRNAINKILMVTFDLLFEQAKDALKTHIESLRVSETKVATNKYKDTKTRNKIYQSINSKYVPMLDKVNTEIKMISPLKCICGNMLEYNEETCSNCSKTRQQILTELDTQEVSKKKVTTMAIIALVILFFSWIFGSSAFSHLYHGSGVVSHWILAIIGLAVFVALINGKL